MPRWLSCCSSSDYPGSVCSSCFVDMAAVRSFDSVSCDERVAQKQQEKLDHLITTHEESLHAAQQRLRELNDKSLVQADIDFIQQRISGLEHLLVIRTGQRKADLAQDLLYLQLRLAERQRQLQEEPAPSHRELLHRHIQVLESSLHNERAQLVTIAPPLNSPNHRKRACCISRPVSYRLLHVHPSSGVQIPLLTSS